MAVKVPNEPIKAILPEFGRWKDVERLYGIKQVEIVVLNRKWIANN